MNISRNQLFISLALSWGVASWIGAGWYADQQGDELLSSANQSLENNSLALFQSFEERLNFLSSAPGLIGQLPGVTQAVNRYSRKPASTKDPIERKAYWSKQAELKKLNNQLDDTAQELGLDVVFVLNAEGYCIASSNSNTPGSIVGTLLNDRHYFQGAISGEKSHQYAVGRQTNVPGIFYSAPIYDGKERIGVMVVKQDISTFQGLLAPYQAFLTDNHDVIVLSSNDSFLQHILDQARFNQLKDEDQLFQYKRTHFPVLQVTHWENKPRGHLLRLDGVKDPVLITERTIAGGDLTMHVYQDVHGILTIDQQKRGIALLSALTGCSLISLLYQLTRYLTRLRQSKSHAEAETERLSETLSVREKQLETILDHLPLMVVARDPETLKVISSNEAAQKVLGLPAPIPAGQTYRESLDHNLANFLGAQDQNHTPGYTHTSRELSLANKVLMVQSLAAKDKDGHPCLLIDLVEDITQIRRDEEEIRKLAFIDTATGLNNRTSLKLHLEKTLQPCKSRGTYGAMILIDLDAFKQVNDHLGHNVGDQLLKELAQRLETESTPQIFIARLASDEFVVVIDSQSLSNEDAAQCATRIASSILRKLTQPYLLANHTLHITASLGIALFGPGLAETPDLLLIQTDAAMYEAKRRQRGTIHFFDENTQKYLNDQAKTSNRLRGALQENDFEQYFQPQVDNTGRVIGVETLLRWDDAKLGRISPSVFIPLAESLHLIVDIDRWVLKQACRTAGRWRPDPILGKVIISVNVSAEFFSQDDFINEVTGLLGQFDTAPEQIMIELTEGAVVEDTEANILKISSLHDAGLKIAIDDFGTGNSSLAYLRQFHVDQIKIDQRFVCDMISDQRSQAITAFIIELAQKLGYETLAEGVEVETQKDLLASLGCRLFQGYLFSKPLPIDACEDYIRKHNVAV